MNKDNQEFIAWVTVKLRDREFWNDLHTEIAWEFNNFMSGDPREIKQTLLKRLTKAAEEYRSPYVDPEQAASERREELIDLFGWLLIQRYNAEKTNHKERED